MLLNGIFFYKSLNKRMMYYFAIQITSTFRTSLMIT